MAMLAILVLPLMYLGWTAVAAVLPPAVAAMNNAGPHGFSEMLYAYTSSTGNNGSAFAGLSANTLFYNITWRRRHVRRPLLHDHPGDGDCGSLAGKKSVPPSAGTFPTTGGLFVGLVVGVILIVGGLTFFPALALGPDRRASGDGTPTPCSDRTHFGVTSMETSTYATSACRARRCSIRRSCCRRSARPSSSSIHGP